MIMARTSMTRLIWLTVVLLFIPANHVWAEELNLARIRPGSNRINLSLGVDPAVVTSLGYSGGFGLASRTALVDLEVGVASAEIDARDLRARLGLQTTLWQRGAWRIAARARLVMRSTSNSVYAGTGFGTDLSAQVGYYRSRWFATGLFGYDRTFVIHLEHSDWYRRNIYGDAVDGWYQGGGEILHGGLAAGVAIRRVEVATRVELRHLRGDEALMPPIVGELSFAVPF